MTDDDRHGHVRPRLDGALTRCGGPDVCRHCHRELIYLLGLEKASWLRHNTDPTVIQLGRDLATASSLLADLLAACRQDVGRVGAVIERVKELMPWLP